MTYSCAVFEDGATALAQAQQRKYERVLDLAGVREGSRVLEIGSGWGGLAIHAATTRGAEVTTLTLSQEQAVLARQRALRAGVADRVTVELRDYREAVGRFDSIVSVEMLEAVGERYLPAFFAACDRVLAPGGRIGLQTITMPHARYLATRRSYTWIHKYVFPGGLIPSIEAVEGAMQASSRLRVTETREIGQHYPATLAQWRERFLARVDEVRALGFDGAFPRMWELYLAYCEAGFSTPPARRRPAPPGALVKVWIVGGVERHRRGAGLGAPPPRRRRGDLGPPPGAARERVLRDDADRPARRHRSSGGDRGRARGAGTARRPRPRGDERRAVEPDGRDRLGRRGLRPADRHQPARPGPRDRGRRAGHAPGPVGHDLRDRERRRLPRPAEERGLRHHQGRRDQPARVGAHRSAGRTASRSSPSARASWRPR